MRSSDQGFTLVEMLAALLILAFGITTLLGAFSSGIATEQNAELLSDASRLATLVRERVVAGGMAGKSSESIPQPIVGGRDARFPGLLYDVDFEPVTEDGTEEVYVSIKVRWLRSGAEAAETLRFPLPRGRPLWMRLRDHYERDRRQ